MITQPIIICLRLQYIVTAKEAYDSNNTTFLCLRTEGAGGIGPNSQRFIIFNQLII